MSVETIRRLNRNGEPVDRYTSLAEKCLDVTALIHRDPLRKSEKVSYLSSTTLGHEVNTKAPSGMNTLAGSQGGFLLSPEESSELFVRESNATDLIGRCTKVVTESCEISAPYVQESSRADGSQLGGLTTYWHAEAATVTASTPKLGRVRMEPHGISTIVVATNRLLRTASGFDRTLFDLMGRAISDAIAINILRGSGVGCPLGVMNASATITVAKDSGQTADTLTATNISAMRSRFWGPSYRNAVWCANTEAMDQILHGTVGLASSGFLTHHPDKNGELRPHLLGRPLLEFEGNSALGDKGDLILLDPQQYLLCLSRTAGLIREIYVQALESSHLYFDRDETAFRVTAYVDGQPWWSEPTTPYLGAATRSAFVTLADRA